MIGGELGGFAHRQFQEFADDPIAYFIQICRKVGVFALILGTVLGVVTYYLKASATAAMNTEINVIGNIGTIFSNIKQPQFQPAATGTAPLSWSLQGVQNFAADAWQDLTAAGSDVAGIGAVIGTLGEDVGIGLTDLAKAFLAFVLHFPDILWNGLVWGVGGSIADVLNWAFPWFILLGGALIIASLIAQGLRGLWRSTVGAAWQESYGTWSGRARERIRAKFDRMLRNPIRGAPAAAAAVVGQEADVGKAPPSPPAEPAPIPEPSGAAAPAAEAAPAAPAPPAEAAPEIAVTVEAPPGQLTQEELEDALGDAFSQAQAENRARGRRELMPEAPPPPPKRRTRQEILAQPLAA